MSTPYRSLETNKMRPKTSYLSESGRESVRRDGNYYLIVSQAYHYKGVTDHVDSYISRSLASTKQSRPIKHFKTQLPFPLPELTPAVLLYFHKAIATNKADS